MALLVNLRHLQQKNLTVEGELPVEVLELGEVDELIHFPRPLRYDLEIEKMEQGLLVQGTWKLDLVCECARCLKKFPSSVGDDSWACHVPLEGEEKVDVINDCVDLTPYLREDILLAFPQHPLCEKDCQGLPPKGLAGSDRTSGASQTQQTSSAWAELNKLKL